MLHPRPITLLSSGVIALMGLFFFSGIFSLDMGSARNMGPGYLPVSLGGILLVLSIALLLAEGRASAGEDAPGEKFAARSFIAILASVLMFALLVEPFGLLPAVATATLIASAADRSTTIRSATGTCVVVTALCWAVFIIGLGLPVQAFRI